MDQRIAHCIRKARAETAKAVGLASDYDLELASELDEIQERLAGLLQDAGGVDDDK